MDGKIQSTFFSQRFSFVCDRLILVIRFNAKWEGDGSDLLLLGQGCGTCKFEFLSLIRNIDTGGRGSMPPLWQM